ncbi:hypothetical protein K439DRAFT_1328502, partial [Ramaria rubella]
AIPSVGRTGFFTSYIDAIYFLKNGKEVIRKGYDKYQPGVFRFPEFNHWHVVVAGPQLTEELRKAQDDEFSGIEATKDIRRLQFDDLTQTILTHLRNPEAGGA